MSEAERRVRRILLPLDVSRDSLTALQVAFDLAASLGSEISGLFIEDAELLLAVSLPFAKEIGSRSGIRREIGSQDIEQRFRAVAARAQDAVSETARRLKVRSSFRVARGDVPAEILAAAAEADLVVLGKAGWSVGEVRGPGRTCLTIVSQSRIPVLIVEGGTTLSPPLLIVNDRTPAGQRALEFGRELARTLDWKIAVFSTEGLRYCDDVLKSIRQDKPHLVILPASLPLSGHASQLKCALLFVP